jgi:ATP-binding cassette, subfamily B, bacterial
VVIEQADFHNLLGSGTRGAETCRDLVESALRSVGAVIGLAAAGGVLASLHPLLLVLIVGAVVPRGWAMVYVVRARHASFQRWIEITRKAEVVASLLTEPRAAEELRAHGAGAFLLTHYERLAVATENEQARLARAEARSTLISGVLSGAMTLLVYLTLAVLLVDGALVLAMAGTAVLAIQLGTSRLSELVAAVNQVYEHGLYVLDWQRACERCEAEAIPTGGTDPGPPALISARSLTFRYPNATGDSLHGVSLTIRRGEVVAFVGDNGSGKTTLTKLLTGLYLPGSGTVGWDGVPLSTLDRGRAFEHVAMLSQDFVQWPFTAQVNVEIGRSSAAEPEGPHGARLAAAACAGGADALAMRLPNGWATLLAHEFWGGTMLSGGEWQRLALARAWFRDAPVIVFDEPTAALDPAAEVDVFDRVADLRGEGKTVLLVTHRLASVRRADRIYVMADGRLAETGTHEELLAAGGRYARMYQLQLSQFLPARSGLG